MFEDVVRGDLHDALRLLGRREAVSYAREFIARHRRIHEYNEEQARLSLLRVQQQQPAAENGDAPVVVADVAAEAAPCKHLEVRVADALEAVEYCRGIAPRRKPAVARLFDQLAKEFPAAPPLMVARAVFDAHANRETGLLRLGWSAATDDGVGLESVHRSPPMFLSEKARDGVSVRPARELLRARMAAAPYTLSVDLEASVESGNARPLVHAVAWVTDCGGRFFSTVRLAAADMQVLRDAGAVTTRVGLYGKFVRSFAEVGRLEAEGTPLREIAAAFRAALRPELGRLAAVVGFNLAQDVRRLLAGTGPPLPVATTAAAVVDLMISGPRKVPSNQWMRLVDMCAQFGIRNETPHDARSDAAAVLALHEALRAEQLLVPGCPCEPAAHGPMCPMSVVTLDN